VGGPRPVLNEVRETLALLLDLWHRASITTSRHHGSAAAEARTSTCGGVTAPRSTIEGAQPEAASQLTSLERPTLVHLLGTGEAGTWRWNGQPPATLERVVLHLVQENATHLGHLDIVAELAGGPTGE
jgi:hypothetical protein